jgi:lipopolysaccharide heptosyltransferase I
MKIELPNPPKRILIIKPSALGDAVHALPVLNLLKLRWPEAQISWLIGSGFADLIRGHPQLDEVITFDRRRLGTAWYNPLAAFELWKFIRTVGRHDFDLVIDLQGLLRSGWMTAMTRAPIRVGFANARELAHMFYTHHVPIDTMEQHAIDRYLAITDALGCGRTPVEFKFVTDEGDRAHVDALLNGVERFALLLPGANWMTKRWSPQGYAELIAPLYEKFGLTTVIAGGPDVRGVVTEIFMHHKPALQGRVPRVVDAVEKTTIRQLVALTERAAMVIANDSGPMHIAAALNRPLVTIFGPTNPIRTGPFNRPDTVLRFDLPCSPCYSRECSHVSCMNWVPADAVLALAGKQLH